MFVLSDSCAGDKNHDLIFGRQSYWQRVIALFFQYYILFSQKNNTSYNFLFESIKHLLAPFLTNAYLHKLRIGKIIYDIHSFL
ncbi:hypothetical protein MXB_2878 [Myxobolus squamalis]|nr:hypothetical protein MXB_2878 [Myxobolus squamalis]